MKFIIFDLDDTLLSGDCEKEWRCGGHSSGPCRHKRCGCTDLEGLAHPKSRERRSFGSVLSGTMNHAPGIDIL